MLSRLGEGGGGVVYAVRDRESEARLALKTVWSDELRRPREPEARVALCRTSRTRTSSASTSFSKTTAPGFSPWSSSTEKTGCPMVELYRGAPEETLALFDRHHAALKRSLLESVPSVRVMTTHLRARAHVALAGRHDERPDEHIKAALRCAHRAYIGGASSCHGVRASRARAADDHARRSRERGSRAARDDRALRQRRYEAVLGGGALRSRRDFGRRRGDAAHDGGERGLRARAGRIGRAVRAVLRAWTGGESQP